MAAVGSTIALSQSATLIITPGSRMLNDPLPAIIVNPSASGSTVFIGGSGVTSGGGLGIPLYVGASMSMNLINGDNIYAVAQTGSPALALLLGRQ